MIGYLYKMLEYKHFLTCIRVSQHSAGTSSCGSVFKFVQYYMYLQLVNCAINANSWKTAAQEIANAHEAISTASSVSRNGTMVYCLGKRKKVACARSWFAVMYERWRFVTSGAVDS